MNKNEYEVNDLKIEKNSDRYSVLQVGGSRRAFEQLLAILMRLQKVEFQQVRIDACENVVDSIVFNLVSSKHNAWSISIEGSEAQATLGQSQLFHFMDAINQRLNSGRNFLFCPLVPREVAKEKIQQWKKANSILLNAD